jgi:NMD protein affecting ribosome stability and mRNA decay
MAGLHAGNIACCLCGVATDADSAYEGMCASCTATQVDITGGIERSVEVEMCKQCGKWFRNPGWVPADLESPELLTLCVRMLAR